ncbi:uncharacterized protein LOC120131886 [Hibiscus syriacus]|uniref:uncharacterized protein LOC120131886 n=1 Tax=Hibiscus syriacus TaxID=106335 RepID=UPI0019231AB0|nr:uncharacterized protein LOC120131886 [Hibiscus syriacus]
MENLAPQNLEDRLIKKAHQHDEESPDTGGASPNRMDIEAISKPTLETSPGPTSYRDTLLKDNPTDLSIDEEIMDEEDVEVFEDDVVRGVVDGLISIDFSDRVQAIANKCFDQTMVVKLLERHFLTALSDSPWTIFGHYLTIELWHASSQLFPRRIVAWIRLLGLPITLYKRSIITKIGECIVKVVKIDYQTKTRRPGCFARMAVSVDMEKPLTSKLLINGRVQIIKYESLPTICFSCGRYGHVKDICPENTVEDQQEYDAPKKQVAEAQLSSANQKSEPFRL